jgi:hypothetical protein
MVERMGPTVKQALPREGTGHVARAETPFPGDHLAGRNGPYGP